MSNDTVVNGRSPVTEGSNGVTTKFPDVCKTPVGNSIVPIPYTNVSKSSDLAKGSKTVKVNGKPVCLSSSEISTSTGDEAGSAKGVASGKTKGKAFPMNYSFDVKLDGKNVVRNSDPFVGNDRNTPPGMIMQAQVVVPPPKDEEEEKIKCEWCGEEHKFPNKGGSSNGSGTILGKNIIANLRDHAWYTGPWSLAAHHLITTETVQEGDWPDYCNKFGYNINRKNNGVILPMKMALACQLKVALHRGNHNNGEAEGLMYPDRIRQELEAIEDKITSGEYCSSPDNMTKKMDALSKKAVDHINDFTWTITSDGKDYHKSSKHGCCGHASILVKAVMGKKDCPKKRKHGLAKDGHSTPLPAKSQPLKVGH